VAFDYTYGLIRSCSFYFVSYDEVSHVIDHKLLQRFTLAMTSVDFSFCKLAILTVSYITRDLPCLMK
jgi:hypothetical protein